MSEHQPIDIDDLVRVGVLVRQQTDDNWLADMVELAAAEIARLREMVTASCVRTETGPYVGLKRTQVGKTKEASDE